MKIELQNNSGGPDFEEDVTFVLIIDAEHQGHYLSPLKIKERVAEALDQEMRFLSGHSKK